MTDSARSCTADRALSVLVCAIALASLAGAWLVRPLPTLDLPHVLVALVLVSAVILAYQFPIRVDLHARLYLTSIPLYAIAVLVPGPALAGGIAALAVLLGELSVRRQGGNLYRDVAAAGARLGLVVLAGALAAELIPLAASVVRLAAVAGVLWAGDLLTGALLHASLSGDRVPVALDRLVRAAGFYEANLYLVGMLGVVAAATQPWAVLLMVPPALFVYRALRRTTALGVSTREMLESLADAVDLRDLYTGGHSRRVSELTARILQALPLSGPEADLIVLAARIHDIGKIGVPDAVLHQPERLTAEEQTIMRSHAERGARLLERYKDFGRGVAIVCHHHEAWDGSGYPQGLRGTAIPFGARVVAVADAFDAMTSDRIYREAMSAEQALDVLRTGRGQQWDATIVDAFARSYTAAPVPRWEAEREAPAREAKRSRAHLGA